MCKVSCQVVQDLLVLYDDDVCSEESSRLIEEHIKDCDVCGGIYSRMKKEIPEIEVPQEVRQSEEGLFLMKKMRRRLSTHSLAVTLIIAGVILLGLLLKILLTETIFYIQPDEIKITEMYELESGNIYCTLESERPFINAYSNSFLMGSRAFENRICNLEDDSRTSAVAFGYTLWDYYVTSRSDNAAVKPHTKQSLLFQSDSKGFNMFEEDAQIYECEKIVYSTRLDEAKDKNARVLWKKGEKLPKAPSSIEEKVKPDESMEFDDYYNSVNDPLSWPE